MATQQDRGGDSENGNPLASFDDWEELLRERYPSPQRVEDCPPIGGEKPKEAFRDYEANARPGVRAFYDLNHRYQTVDFVRAKREEYLKLDRAEMGIWEAIECLNTLVDDSDPDTELSQLEHLLQTAEEIRGDGHPDWFVLTGLIHDLGKILCLFGEPQWAVVGDTFPVGCAHSETIVFKEFFANNPDAHDDTYQTKFGMYKPNCGLKNVLMSWGHDEYLYHVVKSYLPEEALYMIRYHSFYPWHREGAYNHLTSRKDREMLKWVQAFNPYDLYTKSQDRPSVDELKPYYQDLIARYFPEKLKW